MKILLSILTFSMLLSCGSSYVYKAASPHNNSSDIYKGKFSSYLNEAETEVNSWFHYVTSTTPTGNYIVRVFYPEKNQITSLLTYTSKESMVKNGIAQEWYDNGSRMYVGRFLNGEEDGTWQRFYHESNTLSDSGRYENGNKQGTWRSYDKAERLESEHEYINNLKEGDFFMYDTLGNIVNKGIYKADTIFQQENPPIEDIDYLIPSFSKCGDSLLEIDPYCSDLQMSLFVRDNFEYPAFAIENYIQGTAYIQFVVDKDGTITEVEAIRGICAAVEKECVRLIESMPKWEQPGMQAGKAVKVRYTIPIKLRLG